MGRQQRRRRLSKLRGQIADLLAHHPTFNLKEDGYSAEDVLKMADVLIRELPELQPCPFCHLSHNRCDCLRTADD